VIAIHRAKHRDRSHLPPKWRHFYNNAAVRAACGTNVPAFMDWHAGFEIPPVDAKTV
jgi:hypothetical protein